MTTLFTTRIRHAFIGALLLSASAFAQDGWRLVLNEDSRLWLEGDSNIHRFEAYAKTLDIDSNVAMNGTNITLNSSVVVDPDKAMGTLTRLVLVIPIAELKSPTKGLSGQMHKALRQKQHPEIVFRLEAYNVTPPDDNTAPYRVDATGTLSLGGTNRIVQLQMDATMIDGRISLSGETELLMSNFGITPPSLMFGRIRTYDEIVIKWNLNLALSPKERSDTIKS